MSDGSRRAVHYYPPHPKPHSTAGAMSTLANRPESLANRLDMHASPHVSMKLPLLSYGMLLRPAIRSGDSLHLAALASAVALRRTHAEFYRYAASSGAINVHEFPKRQAAGEDTQLSIELTYQFWIRRISHRE